MDKKYICIAILCFIAFTESRQGWKTTGNGYFIYKASTNFSGTGSLEIAGKFSVKQNSQVNNVLVAVEDASGNLTFQYSIMGENGKVSIAQGSVMQSASSTVKGGNLGYMFSFKLSISQSLTNGTYSHGVNPSLSVATTTKDNTYWNLDNMTIYIGGYKKTVNSGAFFQGCLSDFTFQGVNILNTYFQQYPNNTNPTRGPVTIGTFNNAAQACTDATSTLQPTSLATGVTPTTRSSAMHNIASFTWLFLFAFAFILL